MIACHRLDRVLVLLPSAGLGGAEAHAATFARALLAVGVDVRLAIDPPLREGFVHVLGPLLGGRLDAAPLGWVAGAVPAVNLGRQAAVAAALLDAHRPELVVLPLPWPNLGIGILAAAAAAGVPVLAIAHLVPLAAPDEARDIAAAPPAGRVRWVAVAAPTARRLEALFRLGEGSVAVVPNGVPRPAPDEPGLAEARRSVRARLDLPEGAPVVLFAGRLVAAKGADLLPALAARIGARCGATVAVLGQGAMADALRAQTRPPGPLRVLGQVTEVAPWMLGCDALLLPSRLEGCPLVFLEAAARGLPVVATAAALEAWGDAAAELAAVLPATAPARDAAVVAGLTELVAATLSSTTMAGLSATQRRTAAAARLATNWDEAAMLRGLFAALRDVVA